MKAEIISIGDELLIGQTINTNAAWLGQELSLRGIPIVQGITIMDTEQAIFNAIEDGFTRADLLILTGGLGPTKDDITKKVIANYFQADLVIDETTLERVKKYFSDRGRPMLDVNIQQAAVPKGTIVLTNNNGTAPGMWLEKEGKILISLPGVPYEMKSIMLEGGFPKLDGRFEKSNLFHKTILTQGVGESTIADTMQDWESEIRARGFGLAYLPSPGQVRIRLSSPNGPQDEAILDEYFKLLEQKFPRNVFGYGDVSLSEVVGQLLREQNKTVATAESCTGGAIATALVSVSGSSDYFQGSFITYSNKLKHEILHVPNDLFTTVGAVSSEVVEIMAKESRTKLGTDYALSVSGIAGPNGGTAEKPIGTVWIGLATQDKVISRKFLFGNNRERNVQLSVLYALNLLRCELLGILD